MVIRLLLLPQSWHRLRICKSPWKGAFDVVPESGGGANGKGEEKQHHLTQEPSTPSRIWLFLSVGGPSCAGARTIPFRVYIPQALSTLTSSSCKRVQETHQHQLTLSVLESPIYLQGYSGSRFPLSRVLLNHRVFGLSCLFWSPATRDNRPSVVLCW